MGGGHRRLGFGEDLAGLRDAGAGGTAALPRRALRAGAPVLREARARRGGPGGGPPARHRHGRGGRPGERPLHGRHADRDPRPPAPPLRAGGHRPRGRRAHPQPLQLQPPRRRLPALRRERRRGRGQRGPARRGRHAEHPRRGAQADPEERLHGLLPGHAGGDGHHLPGARLRRAHPVAGAHPGAARRDPAGDARPQGALRQAQHRVPHEVGGHHRPPAGGGLLPRPHPRHRGDPQAQPEPEHPALRAVRALRGVRGRAARAAGP